MMRRKTKFKAHDGENRCGIGDKVAIVETRPLSKEKRWRITEVLEKAAV
jgi:small subunit ribosomal protein S17